MTKKNSQEIRTRENCFLFSFFFLKTAPQLNVYWQVVLVAVVLMLYTIELDTLPGPKNRVLYQNTRTSAAFSTVIFP